MVLGNCGWDDIVGPGRISAQNLRRGPQGERSGDRLCRPLAVWLEPQNETLAFLEALFNIKETPGLWFNPNCP